MTNKTPDDQPSEPSVQFVERPLPASPGAPAPPPSPSSTDPDAIDFAGVAPELEAALTQPASAESAPEPSESLEIKWHDEDEPPEAGHLFAEPGHEPPPAPFEIVHERRPLLPRVAQGVLPGETPAGATLGKSGLQGRFDHGATLGKSGLPQSGLPPLWVRLLWGFMPLTLLLFGYASVILTQKGIGHAWDEAYYYEPSQKAADWLMEVIQGNKPFSREAIDSYWAGPNGEFGHGYNEHPSLQKFLSGLALRNFPDPKMHLYAMRLPMAILFGLTLSLIYMLGRRVWGPLPGAIAALLYAAMPRVFGHAHFASMETPLIFMMLLTVFCFLRGLDDPFWSVMTGISFGLLLATKINGFFLPLPLILWSHVYARHRYVNNLFAMLVLGPLVFVLAWPWLWPDPVMRLLQYLAFHARHQQTAVFFLNQKWGYGTPNAPWFYPWIITGVTLPLTAIALIGWGALRTLFALTRRPVGALYLLCALTMLGVVSAPATPKYDGERLFLPAFAFLALLGGSGAVGLLEPLRRLAERIAGGLRRGRAVPAAGRWTALGLGLLILLDGGGAILRYHPCLLSYYNPLVGGLRGVYENRLFETAYWGESLNEPVIAALNALPAGSSIRVLALHAKCLDDLQLWGLLDQDLIVDKPKRAVVDGKPVDYYDYALLQMRQGFFTGPETLLAVGGNPQFHGRVWGWGAGKALVPMIGLYKTGPEFETLMRRLAAPH